QDPHFRREFYQVLLPLMQEMGKTIFAISHDDHYFIHADRLLDTLQNILLPLLLNIGLLALALFGYTTFRHFSSRSTENVPS
ncbi:hypothetical protein FIC25_25080, partial [Escherichia coli]